MADCDLSGRTLGEFLLRERIGEGGYGAVYRGEQTRLGREVAIKVLHERRRDEVTQRRFLLEARLAARLNHPYAAHIYDSGVETEDGLAWIAMELVDGVTLADWLKSHGPMPLDQLVSLVADIAVVVHVAHEQGIIHRDLKPSNIMVIEDGGRRIPKLVDFGIAKVFNPEPPVPEDAAIIEIDEPEDEPGTDERVTVQKQSRLLTPPGFGMGSRDYMSPEQRRHACSVGPETDIYSLGVVIYKAATGRLPFTAERTDEYYEQQCHAPVPPLGDPFPQELDRVLQRALAKRPEARHRNVRELASDLQAALRASKREQLRSSALQWEDAGRVPGLLWPRDMLARVEHQVSRDELSGLECSFIADSERRARRIRWLRGALGALAVLTVLGVFLMRARMAERQAELQTRLAQEQTRLAQEQTRAAQQVAEVTTTQSELEQGRAALLLHDEHDARRHLAAAYRRDHSPSTAFMLARALQPRLAERARLASTFERMWSAAFSPNGRQVVTTDDLNAQVWDAQSYRLLFTLNHGDVVYDAVYSADGAKLVTGCADGAVRIWDAASGVLLRDLRRGKVDSGYVVVALSPDGKLVAGLDPGRGITHVWEIDTGRPVAELRDANPSSFPSLAFSSDGRWLAMGTGNDVQVFDAQMWALARSISGPGIQSLSWDPAGPHLATGNADGDASIWAVPSGVRVHHLRELGEPINAVAFSPDGRLIVAGSRDGAVQVWDAASAKLRSQSNHLRSKVLSLEFDRTSSLIAAASSSGSVAVTEAASGMPVTMLDGPTNVVRVAHFDPMSKQVVGASWDGTARIWDATAPYRRWSSSTIVDACGLVTSLEPDQRFLAIACKHESTRVWDTAHDLLIAELPSATSAGDAYAYPAVSTAGDRAAIAHGNDVEVYELPAARLVHTIKHAAPVVAVAFAASGRDIVSGAIDGSVIVTRDNGAQTALPMSSAAIDAVGFLPDGRVVVADARRHLRFYDGEGATMADLETRGRVAILRMSPDSRRLVTISSFIGKVVAPELWDVERYRPIAPLSSTGQRQVYSARFVALDQVITACGDGAIRLWDAGAGMLRQTYHGGSRFLVDATLSSDRTMLIGGGGDGQLRFWELSSGRLLWTMQAHRSHLVGVHIDGANIVTRGFSGDIARWSLPKPEQVIEALHQV